MDAAKFVKESVRMCGHNSCDGCPAENIWCIADEASLAKDDEALKKYIAIVEKWSNEHPLIKNRDKFKEVFGDDWCKAFDVAILNSEPIATNFLSDFLESEYIERKEK